MTKILALLFCSHAFFNANAQPGKIDTDRPDQTESALTVPKGWFQSEWGFGVEKTDHYRNRNFQHPTVLSKLGLSNKFELRIITTIESNQSHVIPNGTVTETGLSPVEIGGKLQLWEEQKALPKTSLLLHVAVPALASKQFQADKLAPNFTFSMQHTISNIVGLGYNLGAEWNGFDNIAAWRYTVATGFNIGENWYTYIEAFGEVKKGENAQHNIDAGMARYLGDNVKLDISAGKGISAEAPLWYAAIGFSFRFKVFGAK